MPPRAAKRAAVGSSGPVKKPAARATRAKTAVQQPEKRVEEASVPEAKEEEEEVVKVEELIETEAEGKPAGPEPQPVTEADGSVEKEDVKEVYVEEDKGERLELEDNELEYDPEEEPGTEYDEKEMENEDEEAEDDQGEEEIEDEGEDVAEDDHPDMIEEIVSDGDDVVGDDDDEDVEEEQEDVVEEEEEEEEEQHDVVTERRKRKEFEVFVGGLDNDATEEDLKKVFTEVGEVKEVRLMKNPQTKKNKGFAFLRFATVEQAKRAVAELKNPVINGKQCGVSPSLDNDTLFVGNICKTWTKEHLKDKLKQYGVENIEDLTLVEDSNNEGNNRGFAFLEFSSRKEAMDAFRRLRKRDVLFGVDRNAKVSFAESFILPNDEIMKQVKTVFLDGLPVAWDEERVRESLKEFGQIERVELARNMPSARRKDFGFVTFDTHDSALKCAEGINNADLGEGDKKVKVRARLSRPLQKGRGRHATRGDLRIGRTMTRGGRFSWSHPLHRRIPGHSPRLVGARGAPTGIRGVRRPMSIGSRRPVMAAAERVRRLPPLGRSYDRRPPISPYPKSTSKREYIRREFPPRSRPLPDYGSRVPAERRSYRDEYASHGPGYADDTPRSSSRTAARRGYSDEGYGRRLERAPQTYREGHGRDYDSISGSKRPYAAIDDAPPRYTDVGVRQSRPRFEYGVSGNSEQYDAYGERLGRSHLGYGSSRSSLSGQESHSMYSSSRHGISYPGGSARGADVGGMYSSYTDSAYLSRSDVGGSSSYSSLYSNRGLGGSGYLGGSGSGSYY